MRMLAQNLGREHLCIQGWRRAWMEGKQCCRDVFWLWCSFGSWTYLLLVMCGSCQRAEDVRATIEALWNSVTRPSLVLNTLIAAVVIATRISMYIYIGC